MVYQHSMGQQLMFLFLDKGLELTFLKKMCQAPDNEYLLTAEVRKGIMIYGERWRQVSLASVVVNAHIQQ